MKKIIQLLLIFSFFLYGIGISYAATISSTLNGGNWNNTGSWIGGSIPGEYDDVIINGPITVNNNIIHHTFIKMNFYITRMDHWFYFSHYSYYFSILYFLYYGYFFSENKDKLFKYILKNNIYSFFIISNSNHIFSNS
ncbi:MAG: hypothetical protein AB7E37_00300 [Candidatus Altimarinota bacterium]